MAETILNEEDRKQIKERGMRPEKILSQIEIFKRGIPYVELRRPCTIGDGISALDREDIEGLGEIFEDSAFPHILRVLLL